MLAEHILTKKEHPIHGELTEFILSLAREIKFDSWMNMNLLFENPFQIVKKIMNQIQHLHLDILYLYKKMDFFL
jgi:hypothetical protein